MLDPHREGVWFPRVPHLDLSVAGFDVSRYRTLPKGSLCATPRLSLTRALGIPISVLMGVLKHGFTLQSSVALVARQNFFGCPLTRLPGAALGGAPALFEKGLRHGLEQSAARGVELVQNTLKGIGRWRRPATFQEPIRRNLQDAREFCYFIEVGNSLVTLPSRHGLVRDSECRRNLLLRHFRMQALARGFDALS